MLVHDLPRCDNPCDDKLFLDGTLSDRVVANMLPPTDDVNNEFLQDDMK